MCNESVQKRRLVMGNDAGAFVGTWKLVSMVRKNPDGSVSMPLGERPVGYLTYGRDGFMFALLMKGGRRPMGVPAEELMQAVKTGKAFFSLRYLKAIARYLAALSACVSYCGRYEVSESRVVHHVAASLVPDWMGTDLERAYRLSGDTLTLSPSDPAGGEMDLVWERVA
jgi:hypothetical protein